MWTISCAGDNALTMVSGVSIVVGEPGLCARIVENYNGEAAALRPIGLNPF
jgi:hypothetical protein